jgi:hypothetical protein
MLKQSSLQKEFKQKELALMKKLDLNDIEVIFLKILTITNLDF